MRLGLLLTRLLGEGRRRGLGLNLNLPKLWRRLSLLRLRPLLGRLLSVVLVEGLPRLVKRVRRMTQMLRMHLLLLLRMV